MNLMKGCLRISVIDSVTRFGETLLLLAVYGNFVEGYWVYATELILKAVQVAHLPRSFFS